MATNTKKSVAEKTEATETTVTKKVIPKDIDINQLIPVYNGFQGTLVYKSQRTGEKFVWDEFGDVQEMELKELRNAKSASKKFFIKNRFMFDKDYTWVIDYLGVGTYYKNALNVDNFDEIFKLSPAEIEKKVAKLSEGQKKSVSYRARQLIKAEEIDSNKVITALEKSLGEALIER